MRTNVEARPTPKTVIAGEFLIFALGSYAALGFFSPLADEPGLLNGLSAGVPFLAGIAILGVEGIRVKKGWFGNNRILSPIRRKLAE